MKNYYEIGLTEKKNATKPTLRKRVGGCVRMCFAGTRFESFELSKGLGKRKKIK